VIVVLIGGSLVVGWLARGGISQSHCSYRVEDMSLWGEDINQKLVHYLQKIRKICEAFA
jgi:hypothetical protein